MMSSPPSEAFAVYVAFTVDLDFFFLLRVITAVSRITMTTNRITEAPTFPNTIAIINERFTREEIPVVASNSLASLFG